MDLPGSWWNLRFCLCGFELFHCLAAFAWPRASYARAFRKLAFRFQNLEFEGTSFGTSAPRWLLPLRPFDFSVLALGLFAGLLPVSLKVDSKNA